MNLDLRCGDSLKVLADIPDSSLDSCVTDPPYGLAFMGKKWDYDVPSVSLWEQVLRVLKPGSHLLSFSSPRTYHRMVCAVEDAGFEIRDQIMWIFGSGFPKSLNVSKAIDALNGDERTVVGPATAGGIGTGNAYGNITRPLLTSAASAASAAWEGWGTALKPAHEPIVLARKPLAGTVAANVLGHGTGGLNIDACRVPVGPEDFEKLSAGVEAIRARGGTMENSWKNSSDLSGANPANALGRWPANVLHDGSDDVVTAFPSERPGMSSGGKHSFGYQGGMFGAIDSEHTARGDNGSAARFFYSAKASRSERESGLGALPPRQRGDVTGRADGSAGQNNPRAGSRRCGEIRNTHPTVKPLALMRYLCRLVTPSGGTVLDPFMGSGSTGWGATLEGFGFLGIDLDPGYVEIARRRIDGFAPLFEGTK